MKRGIQLLNFCERRQQLKRTALRESILRIMDDWATQRLNGIRAGNSERQREEQKRQMINTNQTIQTNWMHFRQPQNRDIQNEIVLYAFNVMGIFRKEEHYDGFFLECSDSLLMSETHSDSMLSMNKLLWFPDCSQCLPIYIIYNARKEKDATNKRLIFFCFFVRNKNTNCAEIKLLNSSSFQWIKWWYGNRIYDIKYTWTQITDTFSFIVHRYCRATSTLHAAIYQCGTCIQPTRN